MAMKSIILISLLVFVLIATQADAQQLPSVLVNINGTVTCSVNGTASAPPFANATVQLTCGGNVIASAVTNAQGAFNIATRPVQLITNTLSSPCMVRVVTPLSSCNATLPSTGILVAPLQFVGNTIGGLLSILNLIPGVFTFISGIIV